MILTLTLPLLLLVQGQPTGPKATVEGVVLRAGTNQPLAGAQVSLTPLVNPPNGVETPEVLETGTDGRFILKDVLPGAYIVVAEKDGYASQIYGARRSGITPLAAFFGPDPPSENAVSEVVTVLKLVPGQSVKNIVMSMTLAGIVSGRIVGSDGKPLPNITVRLIPDVYDVNGQKLLIPLTQTETDDRGQFRVIDAEAGRYFIAAGPEQDAGDPTDTVSSKYAANTFYPGVTDLARAATVDMTTDKEIQLDALMLAPKPPAFTIFGNILDGRAGSKQDGPVLLTVLSRVPQVLQNMEYRDAAPGPDGRFLLTGVPPGSYWVIASLYRPRQPGAPPSSPILRGVTAVDVVNSDVQGVTVRLTDGISVAGRVAGASSGMRVELNIFQSRSFLNLPLSPKPAAPATDGTFSFAKLLPGEYSLAIRDIPVDAYIKEARFGSTDALSGPVSIVGPSSDSLDIVISTGAGQVSGTVVDADSRPITNIQAVLIPAGANPRPDLYKAAYTDTAGRFTIRGIAPGDYTLLAWEQTTRSYMDKGFVRQFVASGTQVHVSEGSKQVIQIQAIPSNQ